MPSIRWYTFNVKKRLRLLEGEELAAEIDQIKEEMGRKKLDRIGNFKILIQQLDAYKEQALAKPKSKGRQYDPFDIPMSGAGRIALFGVSNVGKSTLMNALTNTDVPVGDFLHTTRIAQAGSCEFENVFFQIVDLPGFLEFKEDWAINRQINRVARTSDAVMIVIDLSMNPAKQYEFLRTQLEDARLIVDGDAKCKLVVIATKGDLPGSEAAFASLRELTDLQIIPISIKKPETLEALKNEMLQKLEILRVFCKPPRKPPNMEKPVIMSEGTTILDFAEKIHKTLADQFRYAKVWGTSAEFPGQRVGLEHELEDSDIVEITVNRK